MIVAWFVFAAMSMGVCFCLWVFLCAGQIRQLIPQDEHRLGKWLAFHGGVR